MASYLTSNPFKLTKRYRRYSVLYEDLDGNDSATFGVWARSMSEASILTQEYISGHSLHKSEEPYYYLTPSLAGTETKTNYLVNER